MISVGNNFNYFPENKLTKLGNFVEFVRMLMFCLEDWGPGPPWLRHWSFEVIFRPWLTVMQAFLS